LWVIPRRLSSNCRRFGTHYQSHLHRQVNEYFIHLPMKMEPIVSSETSAIRTQNEYFIHLPMKMEPIVSSETSAIRTQTPGNYPKRNKLEITYLLTYSIMLSPSWEANWFAASQEIPRISRNPKVHYRPHKRPPHVSILGQPNPIRIPTSHLLEIEPNLIHPSKPMSPQRSPSLRFPQQDPIHHPLLTHTRHMSSPSHSSRYNRNTSCK